MSTDFQLRIPDSLQQQLHAYRCRVWQIKITEAVAIAVSVLAAVFLVIYAVDRFTSSPGWLRWSLWAMGLAAIAVVPWFVRVWVLANRELIPVAKLLGQKMPAVGDSLLGVIELSTSDDEQSRSPALCQAAMDQVATDAATRDFTTATPDSHWRAWAAAAAIAVGVAAMLAVAYPHASATAAIRAAAPWSSTPRYTFTRIEPLPATVVIPHGETWTMPIRLTDQTRQQPDSATLAIGDAVTLTADRVGEGYAFEIPPQISGAIICLRVGDVIETRELSPMTRPELSSITAEVRLPEYLGQPQPRRVDSRGGALRVVRGSRAVVTATANRDLSSGEINDLPATPQGADLVSDVVPADDDATMTLRWTDHLGLTPAAPFELAIQTEDDQPPTLICDGLPRQAVVLESETLTFNVSANDDFGIRQVGMMWRGIPDASAEPAQGERPLAAGGHEVDAVEAMGTFSAVNLGIQPQPIEVFAWADDYRPDGERTYSPPHVFYVLTAEQHAIWITDQLSKWHRQSLDVRDRERQLYEKNKELRELPESELAGDDRRKEITAQATAERANGRRLDRLGKLGEQLVQTAAKNPEIGVGHLERWAEMLGVLGDLSQNRMPSVAELLADASKAEAFPGDQSGKPVPASKGGPQAGQVRATKPGPGEVVDGKPAPTRAAPSLVDMESSALSPDDPDAQEQTDGPGKPKKPSSPSLRLAQTTVMGKPKPKKDDGPPPSPQADTLAKAVKEQEDVLAEFDKLVDELNAVLANLEGSTLVKRLKAASRKQELVATQLTRHLQPAFGVKSLDESSPAAEVFAGLKDVETESTQTVSTIMDDLAAYFERRRYANFKTTLDEMRSFDVLGGLRTLATQIGEKQGLSVAECEYWADALDRWAENLVDPACSGCCPGGKSPESLPPSIVLEVLQILEAEVALRDETRVAEQAKAAVHPAEHGGAAGLLAGTQAKINDRVVNVIARINELEDASKHFGKELALLAQVDDVMAETVTILKRPETGAPAIAAQTEAIELLLRSKRINPNSGGGGGSSPGGGTGGGNTVDSAIALMGKSRNEKEVVENREGQSTTGSTGTNLPEEFRYGLDQYFNQLGTMP